MQRFKFFILVFLLGAGYLTLRQFFDRRTEQKTNTEVVREDEEYLGNWAARTDSSFMMFRLHRDNSLTYKFVQYNGGDTTTIHGTYSFIGVEGGNNPKYFPRLCTITAGGDTIFNYFVRYLTKYDMTIDKIDKMILSPNSVFDTIGFTFYRIKQ